MKIYRLDLLRLLPKVHSNQPFNLLHFSTTLKLFLFNSRIFRCHQSFDQISLETGVNFRGFKRSHLSVVTGRFLSIDFQGECHRNTVAKNSISS